MYIIGYERRGNRRGREGNQAKGKASKPLRFLYDLNVGGREGVGKEIIDKGKASKPLHF